MVKKTETKSEKIEREYTIPLRIKWKKAVRYKRVPRAIKAIKKFLVRHMKIRDRDLKKIKIDKYLNEFIWFRGIKKPPAKIKVKAMREADTGIVRAELSELPDKLRFKKVREEKREEKAEVKKKPVEKPVGEKAEEGLEEKAKTEEELAEEKEKKEEKEKARAGEEAAEKIKKAAAKRIKHQAGVKVKQPKHQFRKALEK